jgi:hypothetical protein
MVSGGKASRLSSDSGSSSTKNRTFSAYPEQRHPRRTVVKCPSRQGRVRATQCGGGDESPC